MAAERRWARASRRRAPRLRTARAVLVPVPPGPARALRLSDADRAEAATRLAAAQRDGRFGASDEHERRLGRLADARTEADVAPIVDDLDGLASDGLRRDVLGLLRRAHAEGRIGLDELMARTDRAVLPLTLRDVDALVVDLGYRTARPAPRRRRARWRGRRAAVVARHVAVAAAAGGAIATAFVAVPCALDLPGPVGQWLPLALGTGAFGALGAATVTLGYQVRTGRTPPAAHRPPGGGLRRDRPSHDRRATLRPRAARGPGRATRRSR